MEAGRIQIPAVEEEVSTLEAETGDLAEVCYVT